jgi:hypothetical protein
MEIYLHVHARLRCTLTTITSPRNRLHVDSPVNWRDARNVVLRADSFGQESVAYLPREQGAVLTRGVVNRVHYEGSRYFGFAPTDDARLETARLVISANANRNKIVLHQTWNDSKLNISKIIQLYYLII